MVCLSCMQKKTSSSSTRSQKKDIAYLYMSYIWATPTWDFFHSFATKINPEFYSNNQRACLDIIVQICHVLPCPHCQQHARAFFNINRIRNTKTKDQLAQLLLDFHNDVNRRTGKSVLTLAQLQKYKNAHFINITKQFLFIFSRYKGTLGAGLSDSMGRKKMIDAVRNWVNTNHMHFK